MYIKKGKRKNIEKDAFVFIISSQLMRLLHYIIRTIDL